MADPYQIRDAKLSSPEQFENLIIPMAGDLTVTPNSGSRWSGAVRAGRLPRIGMFDLMADAMRVRQLELPRSFYGLTLPLDASFAVSDALQFRNFEGNSAHVLYPDRRFDFHTAHRTHVLVVNFFIDDLNDYVRRLEGGLDSCRSPEDSRITLTTQAGSGLRRYVSFVWGELTRGGGLLSSDLVMAEIEDGLIAALAWALNEQCAETRANTAGCADRRIARAEEFLLTHLHEPVSRAALAEVAGVSIRTLSRGFLKRHGVGPMMFLRRQRLDAARVELLAAEPGSTTVSEIALGYGFSELGKFSTAYKTVFGESPSETLCR